MYQNFIIPYLYVAQHVSGDTPPIIRSLKLHWHPLVFHTWKVVGRVAGGRCQAQYVVMHILLMMGGVSPETCWASYKYGIIKFWYSVASCWIFLYKNNSIPCRRHNSPKLRSYRCICLSTDKKKTVRNIVYFQYSVLLCTGYVKDKMFFSPVTSLQPLKVTVALKEDNLFFFISNLINCFSIYVQYLLSSFLYMFQASQAHHQEV